MEAMTDAQRLRADAAMLESLAGTFRILEAGETLQSDDEVVDDNGKTWGPVDRWAVGSPYSRAFKPIRRPITAAQEGKE